MAEKIPGKELGIDAPFVRVSTGKRAGNILAVQHPIFGWLPYRQWALFRLIPEERIVPAIIMGVSTFWILKVTMAAVGKAAALAPKVGEALLFPAKITLFGALGAFFDPITILIGALNPEREVKAEELAEKVEELWNKHPLPFYGALLMAAMTLAGLDAGDVLRALVELIDIL